MKIAIIGAGNMGGAIACGLLDSKTVDAKNLTVIDKNGLSFDHLLAKFPNLNVMTDNLSPLKDAALVILAVKPWLVSEILIANKEFLSNPKQILASVAGGISIAEIQKSVGNNKTIFRIMPNTAIAVKQSMTFITSVNASQQQNEEITAIFGKMGKAEFIGEDLFPAATSLASCGIAYAFRYIRAAMEGGVEMGFYPTQSKEIVIQTLRGAIDLLEANGTHPEEEIDKVTTAGGITIKGLNEMEHAGFTSAVIKGLKESKI